MPEPRPKLLTFDVYGTLVDWRSASLAYLAGLLARKGAALAPERLYDHWYHGPRLAVTDGPYLPYREVLQRSLQASLRHFAIPPESADGADFGAAVATSEPWPESVAVLASLAERYPLAAISNTDHAIIRPTLAKLGNPFTHVVTAEDARAYKPAARPFELSLEVAALTSADVFHIAQSQLADLPRSKPMGIRTAWINRYAEPLRPGTPAPDYEYRDLRPLLELLGAGC